MAKGTQAPDPSTFGQANLTPAGPPASDVQSTEKPKKPTSAEDRLALLEQAVASLGAMYVSSKNQSLDGFLKFWEVHKDLVEPPAPTAQSSGASSSPTGIGSTAGPG